MEQYDHRFYELFDPSNLSEWKEKSPAEFIAIVAHELLREKQAIEAYARILNQSTEIQSLMVSVNEQTVEANFCIGVILSATQRLDRMLNTIKAYGRELSDENDK